MFRRIFTAIAALMLTISTAASAGANPSAGVTLADGAKAAIVIEPYSKQVIFSKNPDERLDAAGLTRLPLMLAVCEKFDSGAVKKTDIVRVSHDAASVKGPTAFIEANEEIEAGLLLKAAVMLTAGDAIYALAEHSFGTASAAMQRANELSGGAQLDGESLSASELAIIAAELADSAAYRSFSTLYMDEIIHKNGVRTELVNQNRLIRDCSGCFGLSTGSSSTAGYCGAFAVKRGGATFVCVVIGASDSKTRFATARELIEYAFASYSAKTLCKEGEIIVSGVKVLGGCEKTVDLIAGSDAVALTEAGIEPQNRIDAPETLQAPLDKTVSVGTASLVDESGKALITVELFPAKDVPAAAFSDHFNSLLKIWLRAL